MALRHGWAMAHQAEVTVSGRPGLLQVYAAEQPIQQVLDAIADHVETRGQTPEVLRGEHLTWINSSGSGPGVRYLILSPKDIPSRIIYRIETRGEARPGTVPPALARVADFPGAAAVWSVEDHDAGTALAVSSSPSTPEDVSAFFARRMAASGWQGMLPSAASVQWFSRKGRTLVISVAPDKSGGTLVTRLLKKDQID